jgi:hypothetical protein
VTQSEIAALERMARTIADAIRYAADTYARTRGPVPVSVTVRESEAPDPRRWGSS